MNGYRCLEGYLENPDAEAPGELTELENPDYRPVEPGSKIHWAGETGAIVILEDVSTARLYRPSGATVDPAEEEALVDYYCDLTGARNGERERVEHWLQDWENLD